MSQYYLIAQLPSLDAVGDTVPPPITEERFYELCHRFLGRKAVAILDALTLIPERQGNPTGSALVDAWYEGERRLRLALGLARADKLGKTFDADGMALPLSLIQAARTAVETDDPLEAERFLLRLRLAFLETLRANDAFADDMVFYYALKLKLILRMHGFDREAGRAAYRAIYDTVLHGEEREVTP